jgi:hypothetical protein
MRSAPEVAATPVADRVSFDAKVAATAGSPYTRRDDPLTMDRQKTIRECAMCPTSGGRRTASGDLSSDGRARWHLVSVVAICVALAACGGGGGGGGGSGGTPGPVSTPDPISPTPRPPSSPVSAAETAANHGIAQIGADVAYAAGAAGRGVKVAVIDSGISLAHPEFVGRIDRQNSLDIVTGTAATLEDRSGHGSHVAGIIAANVDGAGMRGVAPSATLLAIRADLRDSTICGTPGCGYFDSDVAAALDYARAQNVDIVNLSIGKDGALSAAYRSALEKVIASGALVVVAAGNQGNDEPLSPARLADASGIRGGMLVAGAVDRNNAAYGLNNKAGSVAQYFLVAPGVDIFSASRDGGYGRLTGTSMAAPHVAGAAAVLKSAFPSLTMQQVAELLTSTADDLGPRGVDQTFGTGLVNLERALQPVGRQQVAVGDDVEGHRVSVQSSQLTLGSAFGDALSGETSLAHTMVLDAYDRPYVADLRKLIRSPSSGGMTLGHKLRDRMHYRDVQLEALAPLGLDARLAFSESADRPTEGSARAALAGGPHEGENLFERLSVGGIDLAVGSASIGMGLAASEVGATPTHAAANGLFVDAGSLLAPTDAMIAPGTGATLKIALTDDTGLSLGLMDSDGLAASNGSASPGRLVALGAEHRLGRTTDLQVSYAYVDETASLLGSDASGAFAFADGAKTHLGTVRLAHRPTSTVELFAQGTLGMSGLASDGGLLREWSEVRSDAFALGAIAADVARDGDRLGLMVGQPLRVSSASAMLDLPTARSLEGRIERTREQVDMTPSGRELRLELAYLRPLTEASTLGTWLLLQHQPGHDAKAEPAAGVGMRYTSRF